MTTQDIAAIAGKLTKGERRVINEFADGEGRPYLEIEGHIRMRLFRKRLTDLIGWQANPAVTGREPIAGLTPLGLAVRSYIANHDGKGNDKP